MLRRDVVNSEFILFLNKLKVECWRSDTVLRHDLSCFDEEGVQLRNLLEEARNTSVGFVPELDRVRAREGIRLRTRQFRIERRIDKGNCAN